MRAIQADRINSLADYGLRDIDPPPTAPGTVRIKVAAVGVGYVDSLIALGRYQVKPPTPHTPGNEIAGRIEAVGEGVTGLAVGDRVVTMSGRGFAELALAPAPMTFKLPDSLSYEHAAALPLNYLTALHGLEDRGAAQAGETVLVFGAAGGVGSAALQLAKAMGLKVIAATSTDEKRAFALSLGADATIDTEPAGWRDRLKAVLGGAALNLIVDPVCGPLFEPAFRSLGWNGRHLVIGFVGGPIPALPSNLTLMKGSALTGVDVRQFMLFEGAKARAHLQRLVRMAGEGQIRPPIGRSFAFEAYGEALTYALSGQVLGKTVLRVDDQA